MTARISPAATDPLALRNARVPPNERKMSRASIRLSGGPEAAGTPDAAGTRAALICAPPPRAGPGRGQADPAQVRSEMEQVVIGDQGGC
jgi:hypothetical protein